MQLIHAPSLGGGHAGPVGLLMRARYVRVDVRTRAGGLLSAFENVEGSLVAIQGADVLTGTPDPPRGGQDGGREQDCDGRDCPPNQDRKHESAD
jgi:hypothetical protein